MKCIFKIFRKGKDEIEKSKELEDLKVEDMTVSQIRELKRQYIQEFQECLDNFFSLHPKIQTIEFCHTCSWNVSIWTMSNEDTFDGYNISKIKLWNEDR